MIDCNYCIPTLMEKSGKIEYFCHHPLPWIIQKALCSLVYHIGGCNWTQPIKQAQDYIPCLDMIKVPLSLDTWWDNKRGKFLYFKESLLL